MNPFKNQTENVKTSPKVSDEVKQTTCYMCACRCGIDVHLLDNQIRYIEGNKNHPTNKGVLCAKGSAGIMQQNSPAKLTKPLVNSEALNLKKTEKSTFEVEERPIKEQEVDLGIDLELNPYRPFKFSTK